MVDAFMEENLVIEYVLCQVHYEIFFIHCHLVCYFMLIYSLSKHV